MLLCTLVILSTIANFLGVRNSLAEEHIQTQSPSTPWKNNLQISSVSSTQPLCKAGICNNNSTQQNNADPPTLTKTFTNEFNMNKNPMLKHSFMNSYTVGSDRFRFINSFWTSSEVSPTSNVPNHSQLLDTTCPGLSSSPQYIEVDTDEGYATLAVTLQYQGVAPLTGIVAGLKLPSGFEAQLPLETDRNNYHIALANIPAEKILPGDAVTLCFPLNILPSARVQLPVLGPLALHFLRGGHQRTITDTIDAQQMESFMRMLKVSNGGNTGNTTTLSNNFNYPIDTQNATFQYDNLFHRTVRYDYINQVIPVIFKVTGREILDVSLPPGSSPISTFPPLTLAPGVLGPGHFTLTQLNETKNSTSGTAIFVPGDPSSHSPSAIPTGKPNSTKFTYPVNITLSNYGDVALHNLVATLSTNVTSLVTAAATAQTYPLGIVGRSVFHLFTLPPYSHRTVTTNITTAIGCAAIEPIFVTSNFTNAIGQRITQNNNVTLQIQQNTNAYNPTVCPVPAPAAVPGTGPALLPPGVVFSNPPGGGIAGTSANIVRGLVTTVPGNVTKPVK